MSHSQSLTIFVRELLKNSSNQLDDKNTQLRVCYCFLNKSPISKTLIFRNLCEFIFQKYVQVVKCSIKQTFLFKITG